MGYVKNIYCPKCGAEHELWEYKLIMRDKDSEYCDVCGEEIYSWNGASMFQAKLVKKENNE